MFYDGASKYATTDLKIDPIDLCCVRTGILILNSMMIMCKNKSKFFDFSIFTKQDKLYLAGRCVLGAIAYGIYIFALKRLPLYLTGIIFNTSPFWVAILGYFINQETVSKTELVCILGCFIGIVVLMMAKKSDITQDATTHSDTVIGVTLVFITSWLAAFVMSATRKLRHIHFSILLFYYSFFATALYIVYMIIEHVYRVLNSP